MPSVNGKYTRRVVVFERLTFECNCDQNWRSLRTPVRERKKNRMFFFQPDTRSVYLLEVLDFIWRLIRDSYVFFLRFLSFYTANLSFILLITISYFSQLRKEHSYVIFHLRLPLSSFNSFSRRKTSQQADLSSILFHGVALQKAFAGLIFRYINNFAFSSALGVKMKYSSPRHVLQRQAEVCCRC